MRRKSIGSEQKIPLFAVQIGSMFIGGKSGLEKGGNLGRPAIAGLRPDKKIRANRLDARLALSD
jgi:hypothetical protein